jgi:5-formaminoimidazole-4-carboxamide-1-beta-D-ribofuranosyl 5'-monophosphate synthetase
MFCTFSTLRVYPEVISMFCVSLACTESFNIVVYRLEAEHYELLARSFIQTV